MKNIFVLFFFLCLLNLQGQSPERPKKEIPLLSEVVSTMDKATGWILQNNGEWINAQNKIPFREYNLNKKKRGRYALGKENFTSIEIREVTIKDALYSIMIVKYDDGKYDFPMLEQEWQGFKTLKYYAFKEDRWNSVFPDSLVFNRPFAVNMQLLTSGTIPEYNEKTYLFEIENSVQKAIYLHEESTTNLIFAVYPVEINGKKIIRFKFYETINKIEIYIKFLLEHNWLKLFRNYYYEVDYSDFADFIMNIGVIDPGKLYNPDYYRFFLDNGIKKYEDEKFVTALQLFTKAGLVNPPDSSLITISLWKGKSKLQLRLFDEAVNDFTNTLNRKPLTKTEKEDYTEIYYQRGNAYHELHEFSKACGDWQKSLEMGFKGALKPIKKNCEKSDQYYSLTINLKKAAKYFNKALKKYKQDEFLKAQFLFERSWQNNPMNEDYKIPYYIGMCRLNLGDYVRSIDDFDIAYKNKPDTNDTVFSNWLNVLVWRGKAFQQCGYLNQACEDWLEAEKLGSQDVKDFLEIYCVGYEPQKKQIDANSSNLLESGIKKYELGDFITAIQFFNSAIDADSMKQNLLLYSYRGSTRHKMKDYAGAIEDFTKAISLKPTRQDYLKNWIDAYYNRGVSKYFLNDRQGACSDWKEALDLGLTDAAIPLRSYCPAELMMGQIKNNDLVRGDSSKVINDTSQQISENKKNASQDESKELSSFISEIDAINKSLGKNATPLSNSKLSDVGTTSPVVSNSNCLYYVVVGAFKNPENAERLSKEYLAKGYDAKIVHNTVKDLYFLSIYCSDNKANALHKLNEIKQTIPEVNLLKY